MLYFLQSVESAGAAEAVAAPPPRSIRAHMNSRGCGKNQITGIAARQQGRKGREYHGEERRELLQEKPRKERPRNLGLNLSKCQLSSNAKNRRMRSGASASALHTFARTRRTSLLDTAVQSAASSRSPQTSRTGRTSGSAAATATADDAPWPLHRMAMHGRRCAAGAESSAAG